jgi:hypothetical protein
MWIDPDFSLNRRSFLRCTAGGLGSLALAHCCGWRRRGEAALAISDSAAGAKAPHHKPRAKSVICLFQHGGPARWICSIPNRTEQSATGRIIRASWKSISTNRRASF